MLKYILFYCTISFSKSSKLYNSNEKCSIERRTMFFYHNTPMNIDLLVVRRRYYAHRLFNNTKLFL